jgi:hypothetical protein
VEALSQDDIVVALRNPATEYYIAFIAEQDGESLICTLSNEVTAELPVGNYNLEIYGNDKSQMLKFEENYARVIPSTATSTAFVRVAYIVVNNIKFYRTPSMDIPTTQQENIYGWYAWVAEEEIQGVPYNALYTVYDTSSPAGVVYHWGTTAATEFIQEAYEYRMTEYVPANV